MSQHLPSEQFDRNATAALGDARLRGALLVAIPLVASNSWLLGLYWLYGAKLNIFNIIAANGYFC